VVDFCLLGSLQVSQDGEPVDIGTGRQRALLALLLLHRNETLSQSRLIDLLWDEPPPSAPKVLQNCVVRLRRALPDETLVTREGGYELRLNGNGLDVDRFEGGTRDGREALADGDVLRARRVLEDALAEWRGEPLADVEGAPFKATEVDRLTELQLDARLDRAEAMLALGRHREVLLDLEAVAAEQPYRERPRALLMVALYGSGRQADALRVYRDTYTLFGEELGVEPGPDLKRLEQAILRQDPELIPPARPLFPRLRVSTPVGTLVAALGVSLVAFAAWLTWGRGTPSPFAPTSRSLATVEIASGKVAYEPSFVTKLSGLAVVGGAVWVANESSGSLSCYDERTAKLISNAGVAPVNSRITSVTHAGGVIWAADATASDLSGVRLDAGGLAEISLPSSLRDPSDDLMITADASRLWVVSGQRAVAIEVDRTGRRVAGPVRLPDRPVAVAYGDGSLWIALADHSAVRLDQHARTVRSIALPGSPAAIAAGSRGVWIAIPERDLLVRVDPRTDAVSQTIHVGGNPDAIAVGKRVVWVAAAQSHDLLRVDPANATVSVLTRLRSGAHALAIGGNRIWALVA